MKYQLLELRVMRKGMVQYKRTIIDFVYSTPGAPKAK
jgi:hypothetical protein